MEGSSSNFQAKSGEVLKTARLSRARLDEVGNGNGEEANASARGGGLSWMFWAGLAAALLAALAVLVVFVL